MKVFGISCGRKNGNSEILLKQAFQAIEASCGAETEYIRLQDVEIKSCTGCESCMVSHMKGNWDFRCVHGKDEDHFYFIEQKIREADAFIISTPVYNLQPPGILIRLLNKLHASGDYREYIRKHPKLGAAITIGGTDWVNYAMPVAAMAVMEFVGMYHSIVDTMDVRFQPAVHMVANDDEVLSRATQLGTNVGDALKSGKRTHAYVGPVGACPDCHGNLLEYRDGELWCPMCETRADLALEGGKLNVTFTNEARSKSRWEPYGQDLHMANIGKGHQRAAENRAVILEKSKVFADWKQPLELPAITKK